MLFYGPPGTGKTSTILALARQLYGLALLCAHSSVKRRETDDEDPIYSEQECCISVVREKIKTFARETPRHAGISSYVSLPPSSVLS
jgi:replication factor C subunit 2/4